MRIDTEAHLRRPWRIHEIAADFRVEDVWSLPITGGVEDFPAVIRAFATLDAAGPSAWAARALWQIRLKLGELFGWDRSISGLGARVSPLTERLPSDLRSAPKGPVPEGLPFRALYLLPDEWAAEAANRTVHGVIHLGWVPEGTTYRAQMAILVKPNGPLGEAYMAAIRPFRYLVVYPALLRDLERAWRQAVTEAAAA